MLSRDKWGEMQAWVDAYSCTLEANAEAFSNKQIRAKVRDSLANAKAELAIATVEERKEELTKTVANQQQIADMMDRFDIEAHRSLTATWRMVKQDFLTSGWDLREDLDCEQLANGNVRARQGKGPYVVWGPASAQIAIAFMTFVMKAQHENPDPVAYTKRMLLAQGINEQNFEQYQDRLSIPNPWKPSSIIAGNFAQHLKSKDTP